MFTAMRPHSHVEVATSRSRKAFRIVALCEGGESRKAEKVRFGFRRMNLKNKK